MDDASIEALLRRYRVADVPRRQPIARPNRAAVPPDGEWWWGPSAAAAILAAWVCIHQLSAPAFVEPGRDALVATVTEALGGGEAARRYAEIAAAMAERTGGREQEDTAW